MGMYGDALWNPRKKHRMHVSISLQGENALFPIKRLNDLFYLSPFLYLSDLGLF
jgi:hypothetical protein